jgi:hypothetical protein
MITREALRVLENNLTFAKQINREYDSAFGVSGAKIGTVLNIRKPPKYIGRTGQTLAVENSVEESVPLVLNTQFGVDISFSSSELGLSIDDFSARFIKPAIATVANKIDYDALGLYAQVANSVGTAGTIPADEVPYLDAGVALDDNMAPRDSQRAVVISPRMQAKLVSALKGLFQSSEKIANQYEDGTMGTALGFKFSMDQNVRTHTYGALGGAPLVGGANQVGSTLLVTGFTAAAAPRLKAGDEFTIATVYAVNPMNGQSLAPTLQKFTVTSDVSSAADGSASIPISPPIYVSPDPRRTVTNSPGAGAPLTLLGTAASTAVVGLAFHRDAFTLACADLPLPDGTDKAARVSDKQLGLSIRMIRQYDINTDQWPCRLDILYGVKAIRPELACRILS